VARRYITGARPTARISFALCGLLALFSKETAVVFPGLVLLDGWVRGSLPKKLWHDCLVMCAVFGAYAVMRVVTSEGAVALALNKYTVQRAVFSCFGSLAAPWHEDLASHWPGVAMLGTAIPVLAATAFLLDRGCRVSNRTVFGVVVGILASIAPVVPILFVGNDLQMARYLYLSGMIWPVLLCLLLRPMTTASVGLRVVGSSALVLLLLASTVATTWHLRPWTTAAKVRDSLLSAAAKDPGIQACHRISVLGLPDSEAGAYVFRNGAKEALSTVGVELVSSGAAGCRFEWATTQEFRIVR
jgi:hypothetical protein